MMKLAKPFMRHARHAAFGAAALAMCWPVFASAADVELVMFERPFCEWCEAWNQEVGDAYENTEEGKFAPLRRVQLNEAHPADLEHIRWPRFTPTFVMMVDGQEVGRIRGYPGEDFFWGLLAELIEKAKLNKKPG